jgi:hypothetical protein
MSILAFCAAILAVSLTLAGCSSFSTCQYTAHGTMVMAGGGTLPAEPPLSAVVGDLVKPLGFTSVFKRDPPHGDPYVSYSIGLKTSPSRQRVDVVVDDTTGEIRIIDFQRLNTDPVFPFDQHVLDTIRQGVERDFGAHIDFQPGTEHLCFGP